MTAACQCLDCRYPAVGDPEVKALHRDRHEFFARLCEGLPDRHGFTEPSPSALVRIVAGEWDVPRECVRLEDRGKPAHPAHRA